MASGAVLIFADLSSGYFRAGRNSLQATRQPLGQAFSRNELLLRVYPLELNPSAALGSDPYSLVSVSGLSLVAAVLDPSDGTVLATNSTWTEDTSNNTLTGKLDLDTSEMSTFVGSNKSVLVDIEFRFSNSTLGEKTVSAKGSGTSGAQTIWKQFNVTGSPTPVPNETFLTEAASKALFVNKTGLAGEGFTLKSPDGTKTILVYCDDNGTLKTAAL